ncbi:hypothetical protein [Endozoicomonas montiporae]|uniref:Uncharacterized protein n=1 Tax=Endozoicomonas montiporae CL-33 TaxID=570277 RepID=A0A142BB76_9GAMM|nr:hypothetical protein [Endozoicomonas montiporae]AMO56002.1 hypothetical protein EZMO1_1859 [Endozoicomonas montiporae CL-33]
MTLLERLHKSQHSAWFLVSDLKDVYKELPEKEIEELIKQAKELEKRIKSLQERQAQQ